MWWSIYLNGNYVEILTKNEKWKINSPKTHVFDEKHLQNLYLYCQTLSSAQLAGFWWKNLTGYEFVGRRVILTRFFQILELEILKHEKKIS
jgi:hypothetical protein